MPELAEVEFYRKKWDCGVGEKIVAVQTHSEKKVFRGTDVKGLEKTLRGASLRGSETHGKQMLFRFSNGGWVGVHLGMTGELRVETAGFTPLKHDHLVLQLRRHALVFSDPRQFGRILFHQGADEPKWWSDRPPQILSPQFTRALMKKFLVRRGRAPIKAVLLMQEGFPGIGNWMADEVLWQAKIHPSRLPGKLSAAESKTLYEKLKSVCRISLRTVGKTYDGLPKTWLMERRWKKGGLCPRDGSGLLHKEIGGRTTCWCPSCQRR